MLGDVRGRLPRTIPSGLTHFEGPSEQIGDSSHTRRRDDSRVHDGLERVGRQTVQTVLTTPTCSSVHHTANSVVVSLANYLVSEGRAMGRGIEPLRVPWSLWCVLGADSSGRRNTSIKEVFNDGYGGLEQEDQRCAREHASAVACGPGPAPGDAFTRAA